jgi:hypothetical protein
MMSPFADGTELLAHVLAMEPPGAEAGELHGALLEAARRPDDAGLRRRIEDLGARMPTRPSVLRSGDDPRPATLGELARRLSVSKALTPAAPRGPATIRAFLERAADDPIMMVMAVSAAHHEARNGIAAALEALARDPSSADLRAKLREAATKAGPLLSPPYPGVYHGATFLRFARCVLEEA